MKFDGFFLNWKGEKEKFSAAGSPFSPTNRHSSATDVPIRNGNTNRERWENGCESSEVQITTREESVWEALKKLNR